MENVVLAVAPPDYPQLADGLEIGAIYEYERKNLSHYCLFERSSDYYFFDWCEKLVELTVGSKLDGGPRRSIGFCDDSSDLVMNKEKYPATDGRGPFWELLRYGVRVFSFFTVPRWTRNAPGAYNKRKSAHGRSLESAQPYGHSRCGSAKSASAHRGSEP